MQNYHGNRRYSDEDVMHMKARLWDGWTQKEVAREFGTSKNYASYLISGERYPHIPWPDGTVGALDPEKRFAIQQKRISAKGKELSAMGGEMVKAHRAAAYLEAGRALFPELARLNDRQAAGEEISDAEFQAAALAEQKAQEAPPPPRAPVGIHSAPSPRPSDPIPENWDVDIGDWKEGYDAHGPISGYKKRKEEKD